MWQVIGEVLPLALGVAISPIPIIATILMLLSPQARRTSLGFLTGWVTGIIVAVVVFTLLSSLISGDPSATATTVAGIVKILIGVLLVALAVKQWRGRPKGDDTPELPQWMSALDTMSASRAALLGFVLAAVNPKNLLLAASAGLAIGLATAAAGITAGVVFVLLAASTVAVPVVAYLVASQRLETPLEQLRVWLVHNNATIMAVLLLVIGVSVIGKGLGAL